MGAGPFRMVEWREGEQLVVEPNPHWHGGDIPFARISFVFGGEETNLSLARTGAAHRRRAARAGGHGACGHGCPQC